MLVATFQAYSISEGPDSKDYVDSSKLQLVYKHCVDMCSYAGSLGIVGQAKHTIAESSARASKVMHYRFSLFMVIVFFFKENWNCFTCDVFLQRFQPFFLLTPTFFAPAHIL